MLWEGQFFTETTTKWRKKTHNHRIQFSSDSDSDFDCKCLWCDLTIPRWEELQMNNFNWNSTNENEKKTMKKNTIRKKKKKQEDEDWNWNENVKISFYGLNNTIVDWNFDFFVFKVKFIRKLTTNEGTKKKEWLRWRLKEPFFLYFSLFTLMACS